MSENIQYFEDKLPNIEENSKNEEGKFKDPYFPNSNESLFKRNSNVTEEKKNKFEKELREGFGLKENENFEWKRVFGDNDFQQLEENEDKKENLTQGFLGNCYFIAFLFSLKERAKKIYLSIIKTVDIQKGYLEVIFYIKDKEGEIKPQIVFVDDYIPYVKFPSCFYPLFSKYKREDNKFINFYVGRYLLVEKAFAKINGSYLCIEGGNCIYNCDEVLTGIKSEVKLLYKDILLKYAKTKEQNIEGKSKKNIIEEINKEQKTEIFNEIKNLNKNNLITIGTEDKFDSEEITKFGIYACHRYNLLDCKEFTGKDQKSQYFFSLWNPHGNNPSVYKKDNSDNIIIDNNYKGFDEVNKLNKEGLENGNIILNFNRFFEAFYRFVYLNEQVILKIYEKLQEKLNTTKIKGYGTGEKIYLKDSSIFYNEEVKNKFKNKFKDDIDYGLTLLFLNFDLKSNKNKKEILLELIEEKENVKTEEKKQNDYEKDNTKNKWFWSWCSIA